MRSIKDVSKKGMLEHLVWWCLSVHSTDGLVPGNFNSFCFYHAYRSALAMASNCFDESFILCCWAAGC